MLTMREGGATGIPLVLVITGTLFALVSCSADERRLLSDLLQSKGYNRRIRPSLKHSDSLNVSLGVALTRIIDIDESKQIMTTDCWINRGWIDPSLMWNPEAYGDIHSIRIPFEMVWLPDIVIYNTADVSNPLMLSGSTNVIVEATGQVTWLSMAMTRTVCMIDVSHFPYDEQQCIIELSSWSYDGQQLNIVPISDTPDLSNYHSNAEWELQNFTQTRDVIYYSCCPEPYVSMRFSVRIKRRTLFYLFNLVVPCVLLTVVALFGFFMPNESGEKVTLGILTLLAMTVYLMIIASVMPPTSLSVPVIGVYYIVTMVIIALATVMSVLTLNIHHKGARGQKIPRIVKTICFDVLAKLMCITITLPKDNNQHGMTNVQYSKYKADAESAKLSQNDALTPKFTSKVVTEESSTSADNAELARVLQKVYQTMERNEIRLAEKAQKDQLKHEWQQLALVLDRVLMTIFVIVAVCFTLGILN